MLPPFVFHADMRHFCQCAGFLRRPHGGKHARVELKCVDRLANVRQDDMFVGEFSEAKSRVEADCAGLPGARPIVADCPVFIGVDRRSSAAHNGFVVPLPMLPRREEEMAADKRR